MPFIIPDELLTAVPSTQPRPNAEFRGSPDINLILNGDPACFIDEDSALQKVPEVCIIADWTASSRPPEAITRLQKKLAEFIRQGATLYLWQDGKVLPLTTQHLACLSDHSVQDSMQQLQPHEIILEAALRDYPSLKNKKLRVFDDYWCSYLLNDFKKIPRREIPVEAFQAQFNKKLALSILKNKSPEVLLISSSQSGRHPTAKLPNLKELRLEFRRAEAQLTDLKLSGSDFENSLACHETSYDFNCDIHLIKLDIETNALFESDLDRLLDSYKIRHLTLELGDWDKVRLTRQTLLETLVIKAGRTSGNRAPSEELLMKLCNSSPQLMHFTLYGPRSLIKSELSLSRRFTLGFPPLKTLYLENCQIEEDALDDMFSEAVESLTLKNVECRLKFKKKRRLPGLGSFSWSYQSLWNQKLKVWTFIHWDDIANLLQDAKLNQLQLNDYLDSDYLISQGHAEIDAIKRLQLDQLTKLSLGSTCMHIPSLEYMLQQTIKLEELSLIEMHYLGLEKLSKNVVSLPYLKKLTIKIKNEGNENRASLSHHHTHNIQTLIQASIALEELSIDCNNYFFYFDKSQLSKLKILTFQSVKVMSDILVTLTNLRELTFFTSNLNNILSIDLPYLHNLSLIGCYIEIGFLQATLSKCKTIRQLNLKRSTFLGDFTQDFYLPDLQQLEVDANIPLKKLIRLLAAAPNLQRLIITSSPVGSQFTPEELRHLLKQRRIQCTWEGKWLEEISNNKPQKPQIIPKPTPKKEHHYYDEGIIDADTRFDPNKIVSVTSVFTSLDPEIADPHPGKYRQRIFNHFYVNPEVCEIGKAFFLNNTCGPNFTPVPPITIHKDLTKLLSAHQKLSKEEKKGCFLGEVRLRCNGDRQALPSLFAAETIRNLCVSPSGIGIKIQYSQRDNLYYLRGRPDQDITVHYKIKLPSQAIHALFTKDIQYPFDQDILDKITEISNANFSELEINEPVRTGQVYLKNLKEQNTGSCKHRVILFMDFMQDKHPEILTRTVLNDCHAFAEVYAGNQWWTIDLKGYPVDLRIKPSEAAEAQAKIQPEVEFKSQDLPKIEAQAQAQSEEESKHSPIPQQVIDKPTLFCPQIKSASRLAYEQYFSTWDSSLLDIKTPKAYCERLLENRHCKKRLVELGSEAAVHYLRLHLGQYCVQTNRPVYYLDSPADLLLSPFAKKDKNGQVSIADRKKHPLYQFLFDVLKTRDNPPVLIINYDNFSPEDRIRFNTLLDTVAYAFGMPLPDNLSIIALITNKPQKDAALYSRVNQQIETCPFSEDTLELIAPMPFKAARNSGSYIIDLYQSTHWEQLLLGKIELTANGLVFSEGALEKAWKQKRPIQLNNAPWDSPKFRVFWQQAFIHRHIHYAGQKIALPEYFQPQSLTYDTGYHWDVLPSLVRGLSKDREALALNPHVFSEFFQLYDFSNKAPISIDGLIKIHAKRHPGQSLHLNLTRAINHNAWARLLQECKENEVSLVIHYVDLEDLPKEIRSATSSFAENNESKDSDEEKEETHAQQDNTFKSIQMPWNKLISAPTTAIVSTDYFSTLKTLRANGDKYLVMDVSESHNNIFYRYERQKSKGGPLQLQIERIPQEILTRLENGENIVLRGKFSDKLLDALAPILLAREASSHETQGRLVLLSEEDNFHYLTAQYHEVSVDEKTQYLQETGYLPAQIKLIKPWINEEPLSKLTARLKHATATESKEEETSNLNAWQGVWHHLAKLNFPAFDKRSNTLKKIAKDFDQKRLHAVKNMLKVSPFAAITGLTGVGKTTFVEKYFATNAENTLFLGKDQLLAWAKDRSCKEDGTPKQKILFLDEANLGQWAQLNGLLDNAPPGIFLNGTFHELSAHHKVILAFNPSGYSLDRHTPDLIDNHGCAVPFDPMPLEYLYEYVLKPVFAEQDFSKKLRDDLCSHFLNIYKTFCDFNAQEILISPRELQMMCIMACARAHKNPQMSEETLFIQAKQDAYQICKPLVPEANLPIFNALFKPSVNDLHRISYLREKLPNKDFFISKSLQPFCQQIEGFLDLHEFRQTLDPKKEAICFGGLGGALVQGPPGVGKSELIQQLLLARGYREKPFESASFQESKEDDNTRFFCRVPAGMNTDEEQALLAQATDQGVFVIKDEFNASPIPEASLNNLLMHRIPPNNRRPQKPGSFYLAIQNPGRLPLSPALEKRFWQLDIKNYPLDEIKQILRHKGLSELRVIEMSAAFQAMCKKAQIEHLEPPPTTRTLFSLADAFVLEERKHQRQLSDVQRIRSLASAHPDDAEQLLKLANILKDLIDQWTNTAALKAHESTSAELEGIVDNFKTTLEEAAHHFQKPEKEPLQRLMAWWNNEKENAVLEELTLLLENLKASIQQVLVIKSQPEHSVDDKKASCQIILDQMRVSKQNPQFAAFIETHPRILNRISQPKAHKDLEDNLRAKVDIEHTVKARCQNLLDQMRTSRHNLQITAFIETHQKILNRISQPKALKDLEDNLLAKTVLLRHEPEAQPAQLVKHGAIRALLWRS